MKKFLIITILTITLTISLQLLAFSDVPHLIGYQGRLTDANGNPKEGSFKITFRIYDAEAAGNLLWEEIHPNVTITGGIFDILLGSVTALDLPFDKQYYLAVQVGSDPEMSPRQQIASVGYAYIAEDVVSVPSGVIVMWSGSIADIPDGWVLCDGNNGTPDLRDKFIVSAKQDSGGVAKTNLTGSLTQSGGSATITEANLPAHTHGAGTLVADSAGAHTHTMRVYGSGLGASGADPGDVNAYMGDYTVPSAGNHTHTISGSTGNTGSGEAYAQPYYALAFIMKK